ncbi:MAG: hypothetical protein LBB18_00585 [Puniceicoccales bacterium]|nr:hypothetical protein [Puniceicoccales bacterium]
MSGVKQCTDFLKNFFALGGAVASLITTADEKGNISDEITNKITPINVQLSKLLGNLNAAKVSQIPLNSSSVTTTIPQEIFEGSIRSSEKYTAQSLQTISEAIKPLTIEREGQKLSGTHRNDGNCMFYALWEAGLAADTAATLRRMIFDEKSKDLREKCANIEQEVKGDVERKRQLVEDCIRKILNHGVKITDSSSEGKEPFQLYNKDLFEGLSVENINSALNCIQEQHIEVATSADDDMVGIDNKKLKQILTALGVKESDFFSNLCSGGDFARLGTKNTVRDLCNALVELNQAKCSEGQQGADYDLLFNAVNKAFSSTLSARSAADIIRDKGSLDTIRSMCDSATLANRNGEVAPHVKGLIIDVLDTVLVSKKDCYMNVSNLQYAARITKRPILLINTDSAETDIDGRIVEGPTELGCTLYGIGGAIGNYKINSNGEINSDISHEKLELPSNVLVIAKSAVHFFGPPSFGSYKSGLKVGKKYIAGFANGTFQFEDTFELFSRKSENAASGAKISLSEEDIRDLVKKAKARQIYYFSARGDSMWRYIHRSENSDVIKALATTHLALALSNKSIDSNFLQERKCEPLATVIDTARRLECDSCISISAGDGKTTASNKKNNERKIKNKKLENSVSIQPTTSEDRIAADIIDRGAVVFAEMQQNKVAEGGVGDTMPYRLHNYANGLAFRDWGYAKSAKEEGKRESTGTSTNVDDIRRGKQDENIISRSIVGVAYQGYGTVAAKVWSDSHVPSGMSKGRALASVSIGDVKDYAREKFLKSGKTELDEEKVQNEIDSLKGKINDLLPQLKKASKQLVGEVFAVFTMSHLFTKNIVAKFLPVVQTACKSLEVNMDDIKKVGLNSEDYEALYGPPVYKEEAEKAKKETKEAKGELLFYKIKVGELKKDDLNPEEKRLLEAYEKQLKERESSSETENLSSSDGNSPKRSGMGKNRKNNTKKNSRRGNDKAGKAGENTHSGRNTITSSKQGLGTKDSPFVI